MIAMIFEVWPKPENRRDYLERAAELKNLLEAVDGFISIERFESLAEPGKILSLGFFEDERSLLNWRNNPGHRRAQAAGRRDYFSDYRLRIASVIRDYGMRRRAQAPSDSNRYHLDTDESESR